MKSGLVVFMSLLTAITGVSLHIAPASRAILRTPVSCDEQRFSFGQNGVLVTDADFRLYKAVNQNWQLLTSPAGEYDVSITPDGSIYLFNGSIYRSTDGGASWSLKGQAPPVVGSTRLYPSPVPNLLFVAAAPFQGYGTYRSKDDGGNWQRVLDVGQGGPVVFSPGFFQDGLASATLFAFFTPGFKVYTSSDWGQTWSSVGDVRFGGTIAAMGGMAFSPQFTTDRTAFTDGLNNENGLFKTTDGGATWFKINVLNVAGPPAFSPEYSRDQTFIVGQGQDLVLSRDGGRTLTPIWDKADGSAVVWGVRLQDPPAEPPAPPASLQDAHRYYLPLMLSGPPPLEFWLVAQERTSGNCYLYRSRDNGASWQEIAVP